MQLCHCGVLLLSTMLKLAIEWAAFSLQKAGSCVVKRLQFELFGKTGTHRILGGKL